jgi:hypothetical protein
LLIDADAAVTEADDGLDSRPPVNLACFITPPPRGGVACVFAFAFDFEPLLRNIDVAAWLAELSGISSSEKDADMRETCVRCDAEIEGIWLPAAAAAAAFALAARAALSSASVMLMVLSDEARRRRRDADVGVWSTSGT